jgi:DNA-binding transcriptional LysR family regulator
VPKTIYLKYPNVSIDTLLFPVYDMGMQNDQFRSVTLQHLEAFVCLVEERSFSLAARKMLLTQPSLSKHIKNLEIFIDSTLIKRTRSGISLTEEGTILYAYAKRMLKLRDEARDKIMMMKDTVSGLIFAGASTIPATYILPSVMMNLRKSHPEIKVHLSPGDSDNIIHMVLSGEVEIGFIGKTVDQDRRLVSEQIWEDELVLVVHREHPWASLREVTVSQLSSEPFIIREKGSGTRKSLETYLSDHHGAGFRDFHVVSEMGSSEAVKEAVILGLGVSIISIQAVKRELAQGILTRVKLNGPAMKRSFYAIRKRQFSLLPHHVIFLETARTYRPDP